MSYDRGVAHVLGVILMAGFAITVAATVAVAGASMFADSQSQIETAQVESSFSSLAADASELEDGESVEFDLGTADGQLEVREGTGHLEIYHKKDEDRIDVYEENINSLEYTTEDGNVVGYQAGGVFRQHGSGSSVVSAPDFYYRDNALSFPIQKVDGDIQSSGTLSGELALEREQRHYPNATEGKTNPLEGGTVYVELESEYCQGWEEYFSQQTRGSISEGCADDKNNGDFDTVEGQVQVELSVPFELEEGTFEYAVSANSFTSPGESNNEFEGDESQERESELDSTDTLVENKANQCDIEQREESSDWHELSDVDESGLYCIDGINEGHTFDTDSLDGDVEIYVNDDVIVQDDGLAVEGDNEDVDITFYIDGSLDMVDEADGHKKNDDYGGSVIGNPDNPEQTQIFVASGGEESNNYIFQEYDSGNNPQGSIYALIYAPESDGLMRAGGNFFFEGSLIVDRLDIGSSGLEDGVNHSKEASEFTFIDEGSGPEFYYLHVTERTVTASN